MKIVCFGDSNTWGYDPRGYFGGQYDHPWPEILEKKLGCPVVNCGENGRTIPDKSVSFPEDMDLLIVMLGTNDLLQGASPEAVCGKMERFVNSMDQKKILLIAPPPMKPGEWVTGHRLIKDSESLTAHYQALAKRLGVRFADAGNWKIPLAYDGAHFTEEGHIVFAEEIFLIITNATGG